MAPAPSPQDLDRILLAATAAPDHGELRPWRFVVLDGAAKDAFGAVLERAYLERCARAGTAPVEAKAAKERTKLGRAPLVVVAGAVRRPNDKITWDDQLWAVAAAVQNACIAATALGYGTMWRTGEPIYDPLVKHALGFGDDDAVLGFLYLGTPTEAKPAHPGSLDGAVTRWSP